MNAKNAGGAWITGAWVAAAALSMVAGSAMAQTPCPAPDNCATNPSFEDENPYTPSEPLGWHNLGGAADCKRRVIGDGLLPAPVARTGVASISITTPSATDFRGFTTDTTNFFVTGFPYFDPAYDWSLARDVRVSFWYYIPTSDPMIGNQVGVKINAKAGPSAPPANQFQDWGTYDPWTTGTLVTEGHTNNEWVYFEETWSFADIEASVAANGTNGGGYVPYPAYQPGRMKLVIGRWGPTAAPASGVIFIDDVKLEYVEPGPSCPVCAADYDGNGGVDGGDLGAFFADFEAGETCADVDQNGGVDGGDLGYFFSVFEAGGC